MKKYYAVIITLVTAVVIMSGVIVYQIIANRSLTAVAMSEKTPAPSSSASVLAPTPAPIPTPTPIPTPEPPPPITIPILSPPPLDETVYDTVILNARLINPETLNDMENYNIGILDGRIAALTRRPIQGNRVVDAAGLVAAPGFIDILTFAPHDSGARFKITDGVTTVMVMESGTADARTSFANYARNPQFINFGMSNWVSTIRSNIGYGSHAVMTSQRSIDRLVERVRQNMMDGALGISFLLEYAPGIQGAEMLALYQLAAEMSVPVHSHLRFSTPHGPNNSLVAIQEVIDFSRETGAASHINHINSTGATHVAEEAFAMIKAANEEGLRITACMYPYTFWATNANTTRFNPGWQTRFGISYGDLQIPNTTTRLTAQTFAQYRSQPQLLFAMNTLPEHELILGLQMPFMMIGSDTMAGAPGRVHPRGVGAFSRTVGRYARDEGVITLMEALTMMTIRPVHHLSEASDDVKRKGRLEIGADADIVLFCYSTIIDTATPENTTSLSRGIHYVFVNGQMGVNPSGPLNVRAGRPVLSRFASPAEPLEYINYTITSDEREIGILPAYELFGLQFIDLRAAAELLDVEYTLAENGEITFGQAALTLGETTFESYNHTSNLHHEPVIFQSSVFIPIDDLPSLYHGLLYKQQEEAHVP
ncbi:MAG: amidohydrolase family protein [Defluviitaleaceae bacterium]|nr:amidohydrolase family protein [Defluviitaleaceae bacterium]